MIEISKSIVESLVSFAEAKHPIEACGLLLSKKESPAQTRFVPMANVANSEEYFQFNPAEQLKVWKEMEANGEFPLAVFHSHTHSEAYPSRTDVEFSGHPECHYLIVSTDAAVEDKLRSFRISSNIVIEESVRILN